MLANGRSYIRSYGSRMRFVRDAKVYAYSIDSCEYRANSTKLNKESDEVIQVFPSLAKASEYVIEIGRTTNKNAFARISKICNGIDKSAYGYGWKFVEKCND